MSSTLPALFGLIVGAVAASVVLTMRLRRVQQRLDAVVQQLRATDAVEAELQALQAALQEVGERHLPQGQRPTGTVETIRALDRACDGWGQELKHLHKRLVTTLHALTRSKETQAQLRERVVQLDQMLVRTPDYDLRAQFAVQAKERDLLRQRIVQLNHLLAAGDGDAATRMLALTRQNESLRGELRSARRLIRSLERHAKVLEREEAEGKGVAMDRLMEKDLPPGAFDSLGDTPMEDPVDSVPGR